MAERQGEIARLELLYAAHPEGRVFTHLAEAYRRAGDPERARVLLESGLERHADYASAHVVYGRVLLDLGLESKAEAAFQRVLRLDPENLVALRALGDLARRAGRLREALDYYEQLYARDPFVPDIEAILADLRSELGETGAAIAQSAPLAATNGAGAHHVAVEGGQVARGGATPVIQDLEASGPPVAASAIREAPPGPEAPPEVLAEPVAEASGPDSPPDPGPLAEREDAGYTAEPAAAAEAGEPAEGALFPPADPLTNGGELVTETLADLYLAQGLAERAATLYRQLLTKRPNDQRLRERLEQALALCGKHPEPPTAASDGADPLSRAADADSAEPVSAEPVSTEPVSAEPVSTELVGTEPVAAEPAAVEPAAVEPVAAGPVTAETLTSETVAAETILAETTSAEPVDAAGPGEEPEAIVDAGPEGDVCAQALQEGVTEVEAVWTGRAGFGPEDVSPYTWPEEPEAVQQRAAPDEPSIHAYFQRLVAWKPAAVSASQAFPAAKELEAGASAESPDAAVGAAEPAGPVDDFDALFTPAASAKPAAALAAESEEPRSVDAAPPAAVPESPAAPDALVDIADLLVGLLEYQDPSGPGASSLVRQVATVIGRELGMADPALRSLALAAVLQGLGRLTLRQRSAEQGTATDARPDAARSLEATLALLEGLELPPGVRDALRYAHHRWDGADGAEPSGAALPLPARILAVARDFAALLAPSAVAHARRVGAALDEMKREAGRRYDPAVVAVLVRLVGSQARVGFGLRHHVLVVHRRSPTATVLAARLRSSGYLPEPVDGVAQAWDRLAAVAADALLVVDDPAEGDVAEFLARLREDARLGGIPALVVGADALERRIELLGAGADVCFPSDVSFGELRATLSALLRRAARPGAAAAAARIAAERARRYALHGDLADFPLSWLLDVLAFDGRTAVISISTADDEGFVYVERGAARHAETRSRYGEAALRHMLGWRRGTFSVDLDAPPVPQTIHRPLMDLLVPDSLTPDTGGTPLDAG